MPKGQGTEYRLWRIRFSWYDLLRPMDGAAG